MTAAVGIAQSGVNNVSWRNRIINGGMVLDQRNAGASVTPTHALFLLDRWQYLATQTSKVTMQQNAGGVTPPTGYGFYLGFTSSSAYSVLSSDYFGFQQPIEGFNTADLSWGTANAQSVTLSFWVRSSLTGTFGGVLANSANTRSYPFTFSISAANTWEQKSVTVAGDTTGTWVGATNGCGMKVIFGLGAGSTFSGTAGAWAGSALYNATGATSVVGTNGATFYITGVQLERGTTATPFEYRDYGRELMMCQRYYQRYGNNTTGASTDTGFVVVVTYSASNYFFPTIIPVTMRTGPSVSVSAVSDLSILTAGATSSLNSFGINGSGVTSGGSGANRIEFYGTTASGFATAGQAVWLRLGSTGWVALSSEL